jgi:predicted DCC family thiol-disulfide oxidoreductase YuxK
MDGSKPGEVLVVYDGECPLCSAFSKALRIREAAGSLRLVDARQGDPVMEEITRLGLDIDRGMVVKVGGTIHYGAEAVSVLSLMSSRSGVFNRLSYWIFRSPARSRVLYPMLAGVRNVLLKLLGRTRINNLNIAGNERF